MNAAEVPLMRPQDDLAAAPDSVADARQRLLQLRQRKQQMPANARPIERRPERALRHSARAEAEGRARRRCAR
jgi:hypothetical protein